MCCDRIACVASLLRINLPHLFNKFNIFELTCVSVAYFKPIAPVSCVRNMNTMLYSQPYTIGDGYGVKATIYNVIWVDTNNNTDR